MGMRKKQYYHGAVLLRILESSEDQISLIESGKEGNTRGSHSGVYYIRTRKIMDGVSVYVKVKDNCSRTNGNGEPVWDFRDVEYKEGYAYIFMCGTESEDDYKMKPCLINPSNIEKIMDEQEDKNGDSFHVTISMREKSQGSFRIRVPNSNRKNPLFMVTQKYIDDFFSTPSN